MMSRWERRAMHPPGPLPPRAHGAKPFAGALGTFPPRRKSTANIYVHA